MIHEHEIIPDNRLDKIGLLLARLQRAETGTVREEARIELRKVATESGYIFFVGHYNRYKLNCVGDSYLYQVPKNKRGHLAPFRGMLIRIACWSRGTQFDRNLFAGPVSGD